MRFVVAVRGASRLLLIVRAALLPLAASDVLIYGSLVLHRTCMSVFNIVSGVVQCVCLVSCMVDISCDFQKHRIAW